MHQPGRSCGCCGRHVQRGNGAAPSVFQVYKPCRSETGRKGQRNCESPQVAAAMEAASANYSDESIVAIAALHPPVICGVPGTTMPLCCTRKEKQWHHRTLATTPGVFSQLLQIRILCRCQNHFDAVCRWNGNLLRLLMLQLLRRQWELRRRLPPSLHPSRSGVGTAAGRTAMPLPLVQRSCLWPW